MSFADNRKKTWLVLENGSRYAGYLVGYESDALGEVCFNTSMSGYQEILTDPSYFRQIICLTYPMIGNYGIHADLNESSRIQAAGLIIKDYNAHPSNFISEMSLEEFLKQNRIPAIMGLDTRKLVIEIRKEGAQRGGIFIGDMFLPEMLAKVKAFPEMQGSDLVKFVTIEKETSFGDHSGKRFRLAVLDFGIKRSILRFLDQAGFAISIYPARTTATELIAQNFDAYFLSNGPGDPEPLDYAVDTIRELIATKKPIFGICLGHQLLGLALGYSTYKLKFGHRGGNHPVKDNERGRVEITSQNHGFAVKEKTNLEGPSHVNLNDQTIEGFRFPEKKILSVQYHPESSPGPHDSGHLFQEFFQMVSKANSN